MRRVYRPFRSFLMKFCEAQTFRVERHLDVVLEVLQMVGSKLLFFTFPKVLIFEII